MTESYPELLGKLVGNLHSLEVLLRFFLIELDCKGKSSGENSDYWILSVGDVVPVDSFSNYDSLEKLIKKYNAHIEKHDPNLLVDEKVVSIRDLLAHGRVAADQPNLGQLKIIKFYEPNKNGSVKVSDCAILSNGWLETKRKFVYCQIEKVCAARKIFAV